MHPYYEKILEQTGMREFKALIQKWEVLAQSLDKAPADAPILLPDLFLVSHTGTGRSHLLKLLAGYLGERPSLMSFYGDVPYLEFFLNYCKSGEPFDEIRRLMNEIETAAGFRNEYKGIVYVDVEEWLDHCEEKHFISFLEYLSDNSDNWLVILSVSDRHREKNDKMEAVVSAFLRLEKITLEAPKTEHLMSYMEKSLGVYGLTLSDRAKEILSASVEKLRHNRYFDGYKTVKKFTQDVVYTLYSRGKGGQRELTEEDVAEFSADSLFIKRTVIKIENLNRIGF